MAREILSLNDNEMIGKHISDYIKSFDFNQIKNKKITHLQKIVKVNNIDINLDIRYINDFVLKKTLRGKNLVKMTKKLLNLIVGIIHVIPLHYLNPPKGVGYLIAVEKRYY